MKKSSLEKLAEDGHSIRSIAKKINSSPSSVKYWLDKYGIKTKNSIKKKKKYLCKFCGETSKKKMANKGGGRRSYDTCKSCHNLETTKRGRDRKKALVKHKGGKCFSCGYDKCIAALEFHHKDPNNKDPNFKALRYWSLERAMQEVDKCYLLCSNCHREAHWGMLTLGNEDD